MNILKLLITICLLMALPIQVFSSEKVSKKHVFCIKHFVKLPECFICNKNLRVKGRLWCKAHSRYEDRCWICHPELQDKKRMYCKRHGLYEDECFFCHPDSENAIKLKAQSLKKAVEAKECKKHGFDIRLCFLCDASLRQKGRLWCKEHSRYEDRCWMCHEELEDKKRPYCNEHGLYEDECIFCNPDASKQGASMQKPIKLLFCNEHRVTERECGICQPQLVNELEVGQSMKIRFASSNSTKKAGIKMEMPKESNMEMSVHAYSKVLYNKNAFAHISPLVSGIISEVSINIGDKVKKGQIIAKINSMEIAEAKRVYLTSVIDLKYKRALYNRENKLAKGNASTARELENAESAFESALIKKKSTEQKLINYGFTKNDLKKIIQNSDSSSVLLIKAPFDGMIIDRDAVIGELKNIGDTLFKLCDLSNMWLEMSIPEDKISLVKKGQSVDAIFDNKVGNVKGKIIWIDTLIDEDSRVMKAVALIPNRFGQLKSGLFGYANIKLGHPKKSFEVSANAIHELDSKPFVFVEVEKDLFDLRRIQVASKNSHYFYVTGGIKKHEKVVVTGKFTMVSEFLKSKLGAGCVDH